MKSRFLKLALFLQHCAVTWQAHMRSTALQPTLIKPWTALNQDLLDDYLVEATATSFRLPTKVWWFQVRRVLPVHREPGHPLCLGGNPRTSWTCPSWGSGAWARIARPPSGGPDWSTKTSILKRIYHRFDGNFSCYKFGFQCSINNVVYLLLTFQLNKFNFQSWRILGRWG